jgi:hypothetical protein
MCTLRYVEPLSDARTPLADFFSIQLEPRLPVPREAHDPHLVPALCRFVRWFING